jgi:hypothetical protein
LLPSEKTIAIGADHGGFRLKEQLKPVLAELGLAIRDTGVAEETPVDYPDIALQVAELVASGAAARGVIIDGAGIGSESRGPCLGPNADRLALRVPLRRIRRDLFTAFCCETFPQLVP